jgi:hypothetical protein
MARCLVKHRDMEQSPSSEANSHSTSKKIPRLLYHPKFHYRVHRSPPLVPVLHQMNLIHIPTPSFFNIHFISNLFPELSYFASDTESFSPSCCWDPLRYMTRF